MNAILSVVAAWLLVFFATVAVWWLLDDLFG